MDVFVELKAVISEFKAKMAEARGEMSRTEAEGSSHFQNLGKLGGAALAGIAGSAIAVGAAAVEMGNKLEDSRARLDVALKDTHSNLDALSAPIKAADAAMEKFGFTNAQTDDAIAQGAVATGSASKALSLLTLAANLAAYKHIDLASAMNVVAKASQGNTRGLLQLGIVLPGISSKSKTLADQQKKGAEILAVLNERLGGQASAAANTFSGKIEVAKVKLEDMGAKIGVMLIPIIEKLIAVTASVIQWFERHKAAAIALAGVITSVLGAAIVAFAVNKVAQFISGINNAIGALTRFATRSTETATTVEADNTAMGGAATKFGGKLSSALGIAGAGIIAFQGTSALLKSNFLGIGSAVNDAAKAISDFFGGIGQVKPSTSLAPQAITFLEQVASGAVSASNITASAAAQDLHAAGVPGYQYGGYVPNTGLALLHAGETVIPAGGGGRIGGDLIIQLNGQEFARVAGPVLRTWFEQGPGRNAVRGRLTS